jgi:hypothetical protein
MANSILFLRNTSIATDLTAATTALNAVPMKKGQPVIVTYGTDANPSLLFAIGTKAGTGASCYKIVATDVIFISHDARISTIEGLIPSAASTENQLADKDFVNSSLNSMTATFISFNAAGANFSTKAALTGATTFYHAGAVYVPSHNDYAVVLADESQSGAQTRYVNVSDTDTPTWQLQYIVNNTPFTTAQNAAINSGATAALISSIAGKISQLTGSTTVDQVYGKLANGNFQMIDMIPTEANPSSGQYYYQIARYNLNSQLRTHDISSSETNGKLCANKNYVDNAVSTIDGGTF